MSDPFTAGTQEPPVPSPAPRGDARPPPPHSAGGGAASAGGGEISLSLQEGGASIAAKNFSEALRLRAAASALMYSSAPHPPTAAAAVTAEEEVQLAMALERKAQACSDVLAMQLNAGFRRWRDQLQCSRVEELVQAGVPRDIAAASAHAEFTCSYSQDQFAVQYESSVAAAAAAAAPAAAAAAAAAAPSS